MILVMVKVVKVSKHVINAKEKVRLKKSCNLAQECTNTLLLNVENVKEKVNQSNPNVKSAKLKKLLAR